MHNSLILNITIGDKYVFSTALRHRIEANLLNQLNESEPLIRQRSQLTVSMVYHIHVQVIAIKTKARSIALTKDNDKLKLIDALTCPLWLHDVKTGLNLVLEKSFLKKEALAIYVTICFIRTCCRNCYSHVVIFNKVTEYK